MNYFFSDFCRMFNNKKIPCLFFISFSLLFFFCIHVGPADAHKVNIFAYAEHGRIHAEGYFVDGSKCKNSLIEVVDNKTGEKLLEGNTDDNGQFSFDIPRSTSLKLVLRAGTGHQNEYILTEDEIRDALLPEDKKTDEKALQSKKNVSDPKPRKQEQPAVISHDMNRTMASQDIDAAVERIVDKKLQPVMRIIMDLQAKSEKPGLTEILGGIGYILGILGIIAYFKGRMKNRSNRS